MPMPLKERVSIVTDGRATARLFAERGARVAVEAGRADFSAVIRAKEAGLGLSVAPAP